VVRFNAAKAVTADVHIQGTAFFYQDKTTPAKKNLYRVSPDGGQPERWEEVLPRWPAATSTYLCQPGRRMTHGGINRRRP